MNAFYVSSNDRRIWKQIEFNLVGVFLSYCDNCSLQIGWKISSDISFVDVIIRCSQKDFFGILIQSVGCQANIYTSDGIVSWLTVLKMSCKQKTTTICFQLNLNYESEKLAKVYAPINGFCLDFFIGITSWIEHLIFGIFPFCFSYTSNVRTKHVKTDVVQSQHLTVHHYFHSIGHTDRVVHHWFYRRFSSSGLIIIVIFR